MTPTKTIRLDWWFVAIASYFAFRLLFFAYSLHPFAPPDEVDLFGRSQMFLGTWGIPPDTGASAEFGLIKDTPVLYFWLLAKWMGLNLFGSDPLVFARFANVLLALIAFGFVWGIAGILCQRRWTRVVVAIVWTNTLQVTALSATVTYDNLVNLFALAAAYSLLRFMRKATVVGGLGFLLTIALGCLTKITFLPLAAIMFVVFGLSLWRASTDTLMQDARAHSRAATAMAIVCLICIGANVELYGGNMLKYGSLEAPIAEILPLQDALRNRIFRRDWIAREFKKGTLSWTEAHYEVQKIKNRGNRRRARQMLQLARKPATSTGERLGPIKYLRRWTTFMINRTIGYQGNGGNNILPSQRALSGAFFLIFASGVAFLVALLRRRLDRFNIVAACIAAFYVLVLILAVNYPSYVEFGAVGRMVHGRYLFPILALVYAVSARSTLDELPRKWAWAAGIALCGFFVWGDLPYFLQKATQCFFRYSEIAAQCPY